MKSSKRLVTLIDLRIGMCKDVKTGDIYRADHLVEAVLEARIKGDKERPRGTRRGQSANHRCGSQ